MPDPSNLRVFLPWLAGTAAGIAFWATFVSSTLNHYRNPQASLTPLGEAIAAWMDKLTPVQMELLSIVAYFLPLVVAQIVYHFVPVSWFDAIQSYVGLVIVAVAGFVAQQWVYKSTH